MEPTECCSLEIHCRLFLVLFDSFFSLFPCPDFLALEVLVERGLPDVVFALSGR
jgi:hypothetical protein